MEEKIVEIVNVPENYISVIVMVQADFGILEVNETVSVLQVQIYKRTMDFNEKEAILV